MAKAKGGPVLHIPTVLGAVVITYNVPKVTRPLNLTGAVIADIFLGKIKKWNDAAHRRAQPRRRSFRTRTSSSSIAPTAAARRTSSPTT